MEFNIIFQTSRKITIEVKDYGIWYARRNYRIYINGEPVMTSGRVVQTVSGLKPDTEYTIWIENEDGKSEVQSFRTDYEFVTLDVKRFGAKGDGVSDDTLFIQAAISACPAGGRVYLPKGVYKVVCLFLKSDITIDLDDEAVLSAFTEKPRFPVLPGMIESYDEKEEYNLGTWEGNPLDMFASIITGINVSNVVITGGGVLDGNSSYDNWWAGTGREKAGGAFRPRMIFLNHCSHITVQGLTIQNSPAWNLHPYFSDDTRWIDLRIINPKVSPNTDGMDPESVDGLEAVGVYFSLGDDCIAVKSGKFYMGHKYKKTSRNLEIRQCYMRHGHGALTLGSEIAAGVQGLVCRDCLFEDTDRGLRVKTRRGRGEDAVLDDITFDNIKMDGVLTPFVINSFYNRCDPDGHSDYAQSKEPYPVDERTPATGKMTFSNIEAKNCHVAASFIYGLPEAPIEELKFEHIDISFAKDPVTDYAAMMDDLEPSSRKGIYINNVKKLELKDVKVHGQEGEAVEMYHVEKLVSEPQG
ncbi:glycoside hydrolase family 28 protein [Clostridium sp. MCC353]|uniref:glycoside hydrolase family 28 protein n=1 Tax=Clostridium sp. MCC353 TaxID=2592646 RepID=UPI001C00EAE3|nr:glycoside hydrolase family 28 protein [Clostridium sp. MCC353]MBT9775471.1 glycoside hydrolase family 28 protein [Clostridium sp. MCC353]